MATFPQKAGVIPVTATITSVCPAKDPIFVPPAGFSVGLLQLIASNQNASPNAVTVLEETSQLTPQLNLASSGTLNLDQIGGGQLKLSASSGLYGCLAAPGSVEVTAYYVLYDDRAGITKEQARTNTYTAYLGGPKAIRRPTRAGEQQEG